MYLKVRHLKKNVLTQHYGIRNPQKIPMSSFIFFFFLYIFCWACNPPSRVVGFPSETPLNELNYFMSVVTNWLEFVSVLRLRACIHFSLEGTDLEGLVFCFVFFFICLPPSLTLIHVCFCFSLISLGTQERDLKQTFHVGLHVLRLSFLVLVLCICHHLQEEESFLKLSERKYRSMGLLQWNVWIFLFWEPAAYLIVM